MLLRTIEKGENHSGVVIGSAGNGKKTLVNLALNRLHDLNHNFLCVRLNGSLLPNDQTAFKVILKQLCPGGIFPNSVCNMPIML